MFEPGQTRSAHRRNYLLHTPDAFVRTSMPEVTSGSVIVHASPAGGAGFSQFSVELQPGGKLAPSGQPGLERFAYVVSGCVELSTEARIGELAHGGFAYVPPLLEHTFLAKEVSAMEIVEKRYVSHPGHTLPGLLVGDEATVLPTALEGDEDLQVRTLLPADSGFDFAVNTMTYAPGASLSQVEVHVMEHGLLMLEGRGIYRLGEEWYPVREGDAIWMAPYCPQWFGALGKTPAKYLIYKDSNRHPTAGMTGS